MTPQASILLLLLGIGACSYAQDTPLPESIARLDSLLLGNPATPGGDWLLVGRYEVTCEEFGRDTTGNTANLPVVMLSFVEAANWATAHGLRLPTLREWQYLASDSGRPAAVATSARNGLSLNLNRPLPVGVFERGRTSLGAYDFFGNVREWAYDPPSQRYYACGGSYASRDAAVPGWEQLELQAQDRAADIGFRYVADATTYFQTRVVSYWPQLNKQQRLELAQLLAGWSLKSRTALAARLLADGAPEDFCQMLSGS